MAKSSIKRMLGAMYKASDAKYRRRDLDKQKTKVLVTTYNIQQGIKHGYALAQKRKGNLPFIEDEIFFKAARFAMRALQNYLKTPSKAHGIRFRHRNFVFFTQNSENLLPLRLVGSEMCIRDRAGRVYDLLNHKPKIGHYDLSIIHI